MFNRKRNCKNPSCRKEFDPTHPAAEFHNKSCCNRVGFLKKKGRALGITDPDLLWNYVVMHSLYDERRTLFTKEDLIKMGIKLSAFGPAVKMNPNDVPSVLVAGNLGLWLIKENYFQIVKKAN